MDFLSFQARLRPGDEAVYDITSQRRWTYEAWDGFVSRLVTWLSQQGVHKGDRLVCLARNSAETVALHLACGRAGVLFVPLNWRLSQEELMQLLDDCEPSLVCGDKEANRAGLPYVVLSTLPDLVSELTPSATSNENAAAPSLILYTSGTTGLPKGIVHTEQTIMETTQNMALLGHVDEHSTFLCETPMFHVIGLISCVRPALYFGGRLIISDGFEPARTFDRLCDPELAVSHYFCVPQMANALRQLAHFDASKMTGLKALLTGGAPHPDVQIKAWLNDGIPIVDGYGMSEAGTVLGMSFDMRIIDQKAGYVGLPTHRIDVRLTGPGNQPVAFGEAGEIQIKGANLFVDVWKNHRAYERSFTPDGWFQTGDIGVSDEDGYIRIVDRIKDMFISGGENVYPAEVEAVALRFPQILECALIGVPDEKWGESGCLFVVPSVSHESFDKEGLLREMEKGLARYKLPKVIHLIEALPRNGTGKLRRNILRECDINSLVGNMQA